MLSEDILFLPVAELSKRIHARQLSPVELAESYLDRSRTIGKKLNAYATLTPDLALQQAHTAEKEIAAGKYRSPLHGIPYAAKDLLAVKGYPTEWGARPYAGQKFEYDATVIRKLNDAGAVLLGKAAMIELAGGMGYRFASASASGAARNPWNADYWTCGSSSGSAAIAGAGLAAFAIGTETWGSIICPSGFCGLSGLRPTYGRVSRSGAMALSYTMDKIGPITRGADDCDLVLKVISGHDAEGLWETAAGLVVSVEGATAFRSLIQSGRVAELTDPLGKIGGYMNEEISASDFILAQRIRAVLQVKMDEIFKHVDVLATASLPVTASKLDANLDEALTFADPIGGIGNICGLPAISVPCGFGQHGLPVGIQFIARALDDAKVVQAARIFQRQTDWHHKHPSLT